MKACSICGNEVDGFGHNPEPIRKYTERCCTECNYTAVVPIRILGLEAHAALAYLKRCGIKLTYTKGRNL